MGIFKRKIPIFVANLLNTDKRVRADLYLYYQSQKHNNAIFS